MNIRWPIFTLLWFWSSLQGDILGTISPSGMAGVSSDMRCYKNVLLTSHSRKHAWTMTDVIVCAVGRPDVSFGPPLLLCSAGGWSLPFEASKFMGQRDWSLSSQR